MKTLFWGIFWVIVAVIFILFLKRKKEDKEALILALFAIVLATIDRVNDFSEFLFDSNLEIISFTPICVVHDYDVSFGHDTITFYDIGMYLVVEVRNGNNPTYLSSVEISGILPLKPNQYITEENVGMTLPEIETLFSLEKPFYQISWVAWPYGQNGEYKLEPFENKYLIFELWKPIASGQRERGFLLPMTRYFGRNGNLPELIHGYPSISDFCVLEPGRGGIPSRVRLEFQSDSIQIALRAGYDYYRVPREAFRELINVWEHEWVEQNLARILHAGDIEVE